MPTGRLPVADRKNEKREADIHEISDEVGEHDAASAPADVVLDGEAHHRREILQDDVRAAAKLHRGDRAVRHFLGGRLGQYL